MVNGTALTDTSWSTLQGLLTLTNGQTPPAPGHERQQTEIALALIALLFAGLGTLAAFRARHWATKHAKAPLWRTAVRLVPALLPILLFATYPNLVSLVTGGRAVTWSQLTYFAAPLTTALATTALAALITLTVRIWALTNARNSPNKPAPPKAP